MDSPQLDFLQSLQALLSYHRVIGVGHYPAVQVNAGFPKAAVPPLVSGRQLPETCDAAVQSSLDTGNDRTAGDIAGEISACSGCVLHTKRLASFPGQGSEKPRLLIVGSWLTGEDGVEIPPGCILGIKEDEMVARMLSAIQLPPGKAYVTNIVKCALPGACQPSAENIQVCSTYLIRQISALCPEVICTMGIAAARALLKSSLPLSQLRGKTYSFFTADQKSIPLVPTYHPTFLLQNPDFKRATWEDLQNIGRLLKTK
jgi:uracil-DNA glycosylase